MSLETLYLISQIVGVVVIIASLFAILWQGHQTNKIARAELTLDWCMSAGAMNQSVINSDDKAAFMTRLFDPSAKLSQEDIMRVAFQMHTQVGVFQAAYSLHRRGLVEEAPFALSRRGVAGIMGSAIARRWWRVHRADGYEADFQEIMDAIVNEAETKAKAGATGGQASGEHSA
jgi:hypothetical protein